MRTGMYLAPFDVGNTDLALGTLTLSTPGKPDAVVNLTTLTDNSSQLFLHYNGTGGAGWCTAQDESGDPRLLEFAQYSFDVILTAAAIAAATAQGWVDPSNISISFRRGSTPIGYRIGYTGHTITAAWSTPEGRALMGYSADVAVAAQTLFPDVVSSFCIVPNLEFSSDDTPNYEPDGIANHVHPDDNSAGSGVSRYVAPVCREWVQQFEKKYKTERLAATSAHPWTFEKMRQYCRGKYPFFVAYYRSNSHGGEAFTFSAKGTIWRPERASRGNDADFHISHDVYVIGKFKET